MKYSHNIIKRPVKKGMVFLLSGLVKVTTLIYDGKHQDPPILDSNVYTAIQDAQLLVLIWKATENLGDLCEACNNGEMVKNEIYCGFICNNCGSN